MRMIQPQKKGRKPFLEGCTQRKAKVRRSKGAEPKANAVESGRQERPIGEQYQMQE